MKNKNILFDYYPFAISLKRKIILIVGGGKMAERKVKAFYKTGALIKVISPKVTDSLKRLADKKKIEWVRRPIRENDIKNAHIVIAATNNTKVNEMVSKLARQRNILINAVDKPRISDFISPAVLRIGSCIIAVYTDGKNPILSRDLKNFLEDRQNEFLSYRNRLQNNYKRVA